MAGTAKQVTLTGLKIVHNPHTVLNYIYNRMLKILNRFPEDYVYRQTTEKLVKERMEILKDNPDRNDAEEKLCVKHLEEVISEARAEYDLLRRMEVWKPWEDLIEEPPKDQWTWPPHK